VWAECGGRIRSFILGMGLLGRGPNRACSAPSGLCRLQPLGRVLKSLVNCRFTHSTDKGTEARRVEVTCLQTHAPVARANADL
jgi:hypothetical protein